MVCVACVDQCCIEIGLWIDTKRWHSRLTVRITKPGELGLTSPDPKSDP